VSEHVSDCTIGDTVSSTNVTHESRTEISPLQVKEGAFIENKDLEPRDTALLRAVYTDKIEGESYKCVKYEESLGIEWKDLTQKAMNAYEKYVDSEWLNKADEMVVLNIDMILTKSKDDGNITVYNGLETTENPAEKTPSNTQGLNNQANTDKKEHYAIINHSQKEFFKIGGDEPLSVITNPLATGMLSYLLFNSTQDGTRFCTLHNPQSPKMEKEIQEKQRNERERHLNEGRSSAYRREDGTWKKKKLAQSVAASHMISDDFHYAGRWGRDEIEIVDTRDEESPSLDSNWISIKDRLQAIFAEFVSQEWIDNNRDITASKDDPPIAPQDQTQTAQKTLQDYPEQNLID
jgi:hypothetical protein